MASWPDAADFKMWARIYDQEDDYAIDATLAAVRAAVVNRCTSLVDVTEIPDDVRAAVLLWTRRLVARRNSPEGVVGTNDFGFANVARWDSDVSSLLAPYITPVIA